MTIFNILILISKTIFCYIFLFLVLKIMGKREVGEISTFDMVVFFVISEIFSISISDIDGSLLHSVIPIIVIVILQLITAIVTLKNKKIRKFVEGKPTYLIINGNIIQKELKRNRYNLDDLLMQLRQNNIESPTQCAYALLEGNGTLTIIKKENQFLLYPEPIISEGKINEEAISLLNITKKELLLELTKAGFESIDDVFICELLFDGTFSFIRKKWFK